MLLSLGAPLTPCKSESTFLSIYRVIFSLVPPKFSTKKKTAKQPITAAVSVNPVSKRAVIGCLAVFFLILKLGGTCEKNHPVEWTTHLLEDPAGDA